MTIWVALTSLVLGIALAATCGVRTFLPLLALGIAARAGLVELGEAFVWLAGGPALLALATGVVLELVSDKVPWLSSILDLLKSPARAAAGMVAVAATMVDLPLWIVAIVALIVGGGVALSVHVARSGFRLAAAGKSAGALNPALSVVEDVVVAAVVVASLAFVSVAAVVAGLGLFVLWQAWRAVRGRRRRS
jgi:hypothetical protein